MPRTGDTDTTALPRTQYNTTISDKVELEFIVPEKRKRVGDEESQVQKASSLTSPSKDSEDNTYR